MALLFLSRFSLGFVATMLLLTGMIIVEGDNGDIGQVAYLWASVGAS